jgi:glycosyltransferase involved in cell wall biosynthesis
MAAGNPVIASDIPENLEALGGAGLAFRSGDVTHLAEQLRFLLETPETAVALGQRARLRVAEHYSWDAVTIALEQLYERIVASGNSS